MYESDYNPLTLNEREVKVLGELNRLSKENSCEHARVFLDNNWSELFSSDECSRVEIPIDCLKSSSCIYHSHTNSTSFSTQDLVILIKYDIEK